MGKLSTFFAWRGSRHAKASRRATEDMAAILRRAEERHGQPPAPAGPVTPLSPIAWCLVATWAFVLIATVIGIPWAVPVVRTLAARSPWSSTIPQEPPRRSALDAPTVRLAPVNHARHGRR